MSLLKLAAGGSGIHLNPAKKGTFTEYCKQHAFPSVTEECIAMGKRSKNPLTRKRATFAWNARHRFRH